MLQLRMWSAEGQFERKVASKFVPFMCVSSPIQVRSAADGPLYIVGNDSIEANVLGSCKLCMLP